MSPSGWEGDGPCVAFRLLLWLCAMCPHRRRHTCGRDQVVLAFVLPRGVPTSRAVSCVPALADGPSGTSAFSGSRLGVLLASQFRSRVPIRGGTGMCGLPTSWRVQGPEWFCVWALDPVEFPVFGVPAALVGEGLVIPTRPCSRGSPPLLPSARGSSSRELGVGRVAEAFLAPCVVSSSVKATCQVSRSPEAPARATRGLAPVGLSEVVSVAWDPHPREPVEGVLRATSVLELAAHVSGL
ncbi:hypothetical protein Taro_002592 [Colocasia esculenta]|uniref:Uncharacterized protein n=1 Tax=Colocasia esculenta TaxID=4460 RepID=A0A843TLA7_COLES|nr:hypothetical protein [Colocasia esculenta]